GWRRPAGSFPVLRPARVGWNRDFMTRRKNDFRIRWTGVLALSGLLLFSGCGERKRDVWSYNTGRQVQSTAAVGADGTVYFGSTDTRIFALNPDGTEKWSVFAEMPVRGSPAVGKNGWVYVGAMDYHLYALSPEGEIVWKFEADSELDGAVVLDEKDNLYFASKAGRVYSLTADGEPRWLFETGG